MSGDDNTVAVLADDETGDWNPYVYVTDDDGKETDLEVDVIDLTAKHLVPGEVAVFQSVGAEKLRYLTGYAVAVTSEGDRVTVTIDDIYELAAKAFSPQVPITTATY